MHAHVFEVCNKMRLAVDLRTSTTKEKDERHWKSNVYSSNTKVATFFIALPIACLIYHQSEIDHPVKSGMDSGIPLY